MSFITDELGKMVREMFPIYNKAYEDAVNEYMTNAQSLITLAKADDTEAAVDPDAEKVQAKEKK
jgi:hypothetical protein